MKLIKISLALTALFLPALVWGNDDCPCPGEQPYAGQDECGTDVCDPDDVGTYPYTDACGVGVCEEPPADQECCDGETFDPNSECCVDGEVVAFQYDCDDDEELDSCEPCLEITGNRYLLDDTSQTYSTGDSDTSWSIASGASFANLNSSSGASVSLEGIQPGEVTIEASNSDGQSASFDVQVFSVSITTDSGVICDGDSMGVDIQVLPKSLEDSIGSVQLKATKWDGFENFNNIRNLGCSISKSTELAWSIDNARWYAGHGDCYKSGGSYRSRYGFDMDFKIASESFNFKGGSFDVDAETGPSACLFGEAWVKYPRGWVKGELSTSFVNSGETDGDGDPVWEWRTHGAGNVYREIEADTNIVAQLNSQFRPMLVAEENFHRWQFEGIAPGFDPSKHWVLQNFIDDTVPSIITGKKIFVEFESNRYLKDRQQSEHDRTVLLYASRPLTSLRRSLECAAKDAANSQFHLTMECTYGVQCP